MANLSNINNKFIVTDGGNVLIGGNISGSSKLQVTGDSTFTGAVEINGIGTWNTQTGGVAFNVDAFTDGFGVIRFRTNGNAGKWDVGMNNINHFYIGNNGVNTALEIEDVSSNATFAGSVYAPDFYMNDYIYHNGNTNTYIRAETDKWTFRTGGDDRMFIDNDGVGIRTSVTTGGFNVNNPTAGSYYNMSNPDSGSYKYTNPQGRLLTSNGTGWVVDGRDPILTLSSGGNGGATTVGYSIGLNLYSNTSTDDTYSPLIAFSSVSNSGSYATAYAAIGGRKTGVGVDSNWSTGELHFWTAGPSGGGSAAYMQQTPAMLINDSGNVGIGTPSPIQKLDTPNIVIGGSTIAGTYRANALFIDNNGGNSRFYSSGANNETKGSYEFNIMAADANPLTTAVVIGNTGNVGIGVIGPNALLSTADSNAYTQEWTFAKGYRHFTTYPAGATGNYNISTKISFNNLRGITVDYYESGHIYNNGAAVYFRHTRFYIMMESSILRINDAVLIKSTGNRTDAIVSAPAVTSSASLECLITSTIKTGFTHYVAADIVGTGFNRIVSIS